MIRIYEVKTEAKDTKPGHTYDRFNISASDFEEAVKKANRKLDESWGGRRMGREKIQAITILASEG